MPELSSDLKNTIIRNPTWVEQLVLKAAIHSHDFFIRNNGRLSYFNRERMEFDFPFSVNWHCAMYKCIKNYWDSHSQGEVIANAIPREDLEIILQSSISQGEVLRKEVEDISLFLDTIYTEATSGTYAFLEEGGVLGFWISKQMTRRLLSEAGSAPEVWSPALLKERLEDIQNSSGMDTERRLFTMDRIISEGSSRGDLIPCQFEELNGAMGGGFAKGDHTLVASPTGGGKTVLACQLAGYFSQTERKVLLITTEQKPNVIINRMYSCYGNVPFADFNPVDASDVGSMGFPRAVENNVEYMSAVTGFIDSIDGNFIAADWSDGACSITNDLISTVDAANRDLEGGVDILIFDWIGGALAQHATKELRHLYSEVATALKNVALSKDIVVISFAQLNKTQADRKKFCNSTMLHECKALPDMAANAIYVSALRDTEADSDMSYSYLQGINVDKSRYGPGGKFTIRRDFEYQRFRSVTVARP
jgi:KaiC/GvpD/RAD55 family RecA-like ATPase